MYNYSPENSDEYWSTKTLPQMLEGDIDMGKKDINEKETIFQDKLQGEKDTFTASIQTFVQDFNKVKTFKSIDDLREFALDAAKLDEKFQAAQAKIQEFNDRELIIGAPQSSYEDLLAILDEYRPYSDLLKTGDFTLNYYFDDWKNQKFYSNLQPYEEIYKIVMDASSKCSNLFKKLIEDNPETAEVCQVIKERIDDFKKYLPLIKNMSSNAI